MAHKYQIKVRVWPEEAVTDKGGTVKYVTAGEVGKRFGVSKEMDERSTYFFDLDTTGEVQGYASGQPYYKEAPFNVDTQHISSERGANVIFIKNTGRKYVSSSNLGAKANWSVKIMAGENDKECLGVLGPGGGMIAGWDVNCKLDCTHFFVRTVNNNGTNGTMDNMAVKFLIGNVAPHDYAVSCFGLNNLSVGNL